MGDKQEPVDTLDMELVGEQELNHLQRQYRIMEGDREAYTSEVATKLKIQKNTIKQLKKEQNIIMTDLKVATSEAKKRHDKALNKHIGTLLEERDKIELTIKTKKEHLSLLDYQIKRVDREIRRIEAKTITDAQRQKKIQGGQKAVQNLENRLEVTLRKFNCVVAENFNLRKEIDHLLKERAHFNYLWEKLISCLNDGKNFMLDLIEQASLAYYQREQWCNKLQILRQKGQQHLVAHTQEMRQLQRRLDHDAKVQEFLDVKGQKRILTNLELREAKKKEQTKRDMERQLALYRDTLAHIQELCKETDAERLAARYIKQEEENFALFNYVNELNLESELLRTALGDLNVNIGEVKDQIDRQEENQSEKMDKLVIKLEEEIDNVATAEQKLMEFNASIEKILNGVEQIFKILRCDRTPILGLLGISAVVTSYNVMMYIGLIEKRTSELIHDSYYRERLMIATRSKKSKAAANKPDKENKNYHFENLVPIQQPQADQLVCNPMDDNTVLNKVEEICN